MTDQLLLDQASLIVSVLPRLTRQISRNDPAMDLPVAQLRICGILREGPRTMSALSRELGITHSAITQIADRMQRAGLIERVPEADDRRVKSLRLTERGVELVQCRKRNRTERMLEVLEHLDPDAREAVICALQSLLDACLTAFPGLPDDVPVLDTIAS